MGRKAKGSEDPALVYAKTLPYLNDLKFLETKTGRRTAVLVPLDGFRRLVRDYWAMASTLKAKGEDMVDCEDALTELRKDGIVPS